MSENGENVSGKVKEYGAMQSTDSVISIKGLELKEEVKSTKASFEDALTIAGFGRYNYLLFLVALPSCWAALFVPASTAFVLPEAQCDFGLSLLDMGFLNAAPFFGMIISALFWGYLSDTFGRKRLIIYGYISDGICNVICAFSVNIWMLSICKFCSGFIISGPFATLLTNLSEFHSAKHRKTVFVITGMYIGTVNFIAPMLAWIIMPMNKIYIGNYVVSSWQIYVLICALPSLISGTCFTFFPESPKFLIIVGKYTEALQVLKKMYSINCKKPEDTYPISDLLINVSVSQNRIENKTGKRGILKKGWQQIKPLFFPPYLGTACLVFVMQFCSLLGSNTLKLWLPQLFTIMDNYEQITGNSGSNISICEIINSFPKDNNVSAIHVEDACSGTAIISNDQVYINSGIVGICSIVMYIIVAIVTNWLNSKTILGWLYGISGLCGLALIWASDPTVMLAFASVYAAMSGCACHLLLGVVVELFPTSLRTMMVSLNIMMGRIGTIIGNVIFPMLLVLGCLPPFLLLGGIILVCLPLLFLIKPTKEENFQ